jgi:hypothetical protein
MSDTLPGTSSETKRLARRLVLNTLRAPFQASRIDLQPSPGDAEDWERRKVLPPFLGEMGFEIRYFLAAIEPWLRSGWRIPARRPEYYPGGTAFADPALFAELDAVLDENRAKPIGGSFSLIGGAGGGCAVGASADRASGLQVRVICPDGEQVQRGVKAALLEQALRRIFARHHMPHSRPITPWDRALTEGFDARPEQLCGGPIVLAPSYKPDAFVNPAYVPTPHIGVQLRHLPHSPGRNSDVPVMLAAARDAGQHLNLPVLVYGHPAGTVRPEGLPSTFQLASEDLLRYELSMLSQCRVMFCPESGWCDLMCWLQVPTLLESLHRPHTFSGNNVFRPRVNMLDREMPIPQQVDRLLATAQSVPLAVRDAEVYDDLDWDGIWISDLASEFVNM